MQKTFVSNNARQTQELGRLLAEELRGGEIVCLSGEIGAGKTTFTQGLLEGLGVKGPYTSPTFVIMKKYCVTRNVKRETKKKELHASRFTLCDVYHFDAYRVGVPDILNLGWEEIVADKNKVVIIEWAERIMEIVPEYSLWINFKWMTENKRQVIFKRYKKQETRNRSK
jgi:tRNA threonylcarbamoyladenosine biosynthesis protein TsaE